MLAIKFGFNRSFTFDDDCWGFDDEIYGQHVIGQ